MIALLEDPIGPGSPLSLWFLFGSVVVLLTTLFAGFRIVAVIRSELSAYVKQREYEIQRVADERIREVERRALIEMMGEIKTAVAKLERRFALQDEEEET